MKTWLAKFKISAALDSGEPPREKMPGASVQSETLKRFEKSMQSLDDCLKVVRPAATVPVGIHESVMRAVRKASRTEEQRSAPAVWRWLPAPALALLMAFGFWLVLNRPAHEPQLLTTAAAALEESHVMAQKAPGAALAPLSREMELLNRDFRSAVDFLVASVP